MKSTFRWFRRKKDRQRYERESFHARLAMEQMGMAEVAARIKAAEIRVKNELRTK